MLHGDCLPHLPGRRPAWARVGRDLTHAVCFRAVKRGRLARVPAAAELDRLRARLRGARARWWSPSRAGPTPRCWPGSPTTCSATRALAVTAVSPSLPADERDACAALAGELGDGAGRRSPPTSSTTPTTPATTATAATGARTRCSPRSAPLAEAERGATVCLGVNARRPRRPPPGPATPPPSGAPCSRSSTPGSRRTAVREVSRDLGLATWDKPAAACLASRLPYGTAVTLGRLASVERAEAGAAGARVRRAAGAPPRRGRPHRGARARPRRRAWPSGRPWSTPCTAAGYRWATLDLAGLRSGGFNQLLA